MKNYELLYVLPASETSEEIVKNFQDVQKHIEKFGGVMLETLLDHPFLTKAGMSKEDEPDEIKALPLVKRKLAYPIKHERFGYYCLVNFSAEGKKIEDLDEYLRLNKVVLRHIILEAEPMTKEELERLQTLFARKKAEQEKEEAENGKAREDRRGARKEAESERRETAREAQPAPIEEAAAEEKTAEVKEEAKEEVKEEKAAAAQVKAEETEKEAKAEVKAEKAASAEKKEDSKAKKSKIKLEELEDKLDAILEDTIV